jgi:regulator of sigma E protease
MSTFISIFFAIILFSLLIFVHELGHFLAAKAFKVRVNEFSMFMGPAIFKKKIGDTLYSIRCIPIGGYCAMEGEDQDTDDPNSLQKAAWWKRLIIFVAGAFMNFIAGFLLFAIIFMPMKGMITPVIDSFSEESLITGVNGLQPGDEFLKIDGEKIFVYEDFLTILSINGGEVHDLEVLRNGEKVVLNDFAMKTYDTTDEKGNPTRMYGINFKVIQPTFMDKLQYVWDYCLDNVRNVRLSLKMLFTGKAGINDMSGAVGIVAIMTDAATEAETTMAAIRTMVYFCGFLAVNLAVMNLLPFPALDGGRVVALLLTTTIEAITKKKIDPKYEGYIHGAGMVLLLTVMLLITFKDIFTIFKG